MAGNKDLVLKQTNSYLDLMLTKDAGALPAGFNPLRFKQNAMTVLSDTNGLEKLQGNEYSLARTIMKGAYLGLDFFNKECYCIIYGNKAEFQTDYKGEIKLAKKYSINPVKDIYAKLVREGDDFEEYIKDGHQTINFKPKSFNNGEIIGAFAVCLFQDGGMIYEAMSKEEIEEVRKNYSMPLASSKAFCCSIVSKSNSINLHNLLSTVFLYISPLLLVQLGPFGTLE